MSEVEQAFEVGSSNVFELADRRRDDDVIEVPVDTPPPKVRRDVIAPWMRSPRAARSMALWQLRHARHGAAFHGVRLAAYLWRLLLRLPAGLRAIAGPVLAWIWDAEGRRIIKAQRASLHMVTDPTHDLYNRHAQEEFDARKSARNFGVGSRLTIVLAGIALLSYIAWFVGERTTWWERIPVLLGLALVVGVVGRDPEKAIVPVRATSTEKSRRPTADVIVDALDRVGIPRLDVEALKFVEPTTREGSGWRSTVDLGIPAAAVVAKRLEFAAALERPLSCVFLEADPTGENAGRLSIWVADKPRNQMKPTPWPLAKASRFNIFEPLVIGTDLRGREVKVTLMFKSGLIGAIPQVGKTEALRVMMTAAAMDPSVELHVYNGKGGNGFVDLKPVSHKWRAGGDDEDVTALLADLLALSADIKRRYKTMESLPPSLCPKNRVTEALCADPTLGLHPVFMGIDEVQVFIAHPIHGAEIGKLLVDITKVGPAAGVMVWSATQRPDAGSLPTGITANAGIRMCFAVKHHTENDMILGTNAFVNGMKATEFTLEDKGLCWIDGHARRSEICQVSEITADTSAKVIARALKLRAAMAVQPAADVDLDTGSVIDHLVKVWPAGEAKATLEDLATALRVAYPKVHRDWEAGHITTAVKPHGVKTIAINRRVSGQQVGKRGLALADLQAASTQD